MKFVALQCLEIRSSLKLATFLNFVEAEHIPTTGGRGLEFQVFDANW